MWNEYTTSQAAQDSKTRYFFDCVRVDGTGRSTVPRIAYRDDIYRMAIDWQIDYLLDKYEQESPDSYRPDPAIDLTELFVNTEDCYITLDIKTNDGIVSLRTDNGSLDDLIQDMHRNFSVTSTAEKVSNTKRLATALWERADNPVFIRQLAKLLNYVEGQLAIDISSLHEQVYTNE